MRFSTTPGLIVVAVCLADELRARTTQGHLEGP
jgi:hypothetical protein